MSEKEIKYYKLIVHSRNREERSELEDYLTSEIGNFRIQRNGYTRNTYTFEEPLNDDQVMKITRRLVGKVKCWTFKRE